MENPRNPDDALELMNEGLRFDTTKRDSLIFYHIVFFTWKNDKMNQQKAMYLALVYRYLLNDVGRATKFSRRQRKTAHPNSTLKILLLNFGRSNFGTSKQIFWTKEYSRAVLYYRCSVKSFLKCPNNMFWMSKSF